MKFDLVIKNTKILIKNDRDYLYLDGVLKSEFLDSNSLYFGCPGKAICEAKFVRKENENNFSSIIEIPKNKNIKGIYFIYIAKEKIKLLGSIELDPKKIEVNKTYQEVIIREKSPAINAILNSEEIKLKFKAEILKNKENFLEVKLIAIFVVKNLQQLKLLELSAGGNKFILPDEVKIEEKEGFFYVTAGTILKLENLNSLSQDFTLKVYNNENIFEFNSSAEFIENLTLKEYYLQETLPLNERKFVKQEKSISLILEVNNFNSHAEECLNNICKYNKIIENIFLVSNKENFNKISNYFPDLTFLYSEEGKNWIENISILESESLQNNFLYLSCSAELTDYSLSLVPFLNQREREIFIPKLVAKNNKIIAAGNFIIGNEIVFDYGKGENNNLSKFNFERKLSACSDSAFFFSRKVLSNIKNLNKDIFSNYKLHEIVNYLSVYDNLELTYTPEVEITINEKNNQFYKVKEFINSMNQSDSIELDRRRKILIIGNSKIIKNINTHIEQLLADGFLITVIKYGKIESDFLKQEQMTKIEWINNLSTKEIFNFIHNRKDYYLATWILSNSILKVFKDRNFSSRVIYTPEIQKSTIGKYFINNKILYSSLRQKTIEKQILTNSEGDIFAINQFKNLANVCLLTSNTDIYRILSSNKIPINLLNKNNLDLAITGNQIKEEKETACNENQIKAKSLNELVKVNKEQLCRFDKTVDIILPIYNSYDSVKLCIESIFEASDLPFKLFLVNDCSTDLNIRKLIVNTKKKEGENFNEEIIIIDNRVNLGYTKSVNLCLSITENDVLLLNSDCILPKNSLSKLFKPIFSSNKIATVSPLTNDNSILSLVDKNDQFESIIRNLDNLELINSLLSNSINGQYIELPTGVGYCMAIARNAITKIGQYDSELFPKMYGEENDFCIRALNSGFKNVLASNLFVHHYESLSEKESSSANKTELLQNALINLNLTYKGYDGLVSSDKLLNQLTQIKNFIRLLLTTTSSEKEFMLIVHNPGLKGGSFEFLKDLKLRFANEYKYLYLLADEKHLSITYFSDNNLKNEISIDFSWDEINANTGMILKKLRVSRIFVNQLYGMQFRNIISLFQETKIPYDFITHDFFSICPSITLTNKDNTFCRLETNPDNCANCLKGKFPEREETFNTDFVREWRVVFHQFLKNAQNVFCPSEDTIKKHKAYYPDINYKVLKCRVNPFVEYVNDIHTIERNTFHLGILGAINDHKGLKIIEALDSWIKKYDKNIKITVIGHTSNQTTAYESVDGRLRITGPYNPILVSKILKEVNPDLVLGISMMMETYCYTAREAIFSGFPMLSFDEGPVANLIRNNLKLGWLTRYANIDELTDKIDYLNENRELVTKKAIELQSYLENLRSFSYQGTVDYQEQGLLKIVRDGN